MDEPVGENVKSATKHKSNTPEDCELPWKKPRLVDMTIEKKKADRKLIKSMKSNKEKKAKMQRVG